MILIAIEPWLRTAASLVALLAWACNFYLAAQYILLPKRRSRFSEESGVWGVGWFLWVGGYLLIYSAHDSRSWPMADGGHLCIIGGAACMIYTARRHWKERAEEKQAAQQTEQAVPEENGSVWPPPPTQS